MSEPYPEWNRLETLLATVKSRGSRHLGAEEIVEFGKLYRRAAAELAFQRTHQADPKRLAYLNNLVGQCYAQVYVAPRHPWPSVGRFFAVDYPRAIRRHALWILLATVLSLLPALIGFALTWHDRAVADQVLPADLMESLDFIVARHHTPKDWMELMARGPSAGFIMTNNIRVAVIAFAGGMTAGLVTLYILIFNGIMLGVTAAAVSMDGPSTALNFWAFVAPHGVLELPAIFISAGAGLMLAYAIANPGEVPRRVALRLAGKEAIILVLGVAATLVVAGCIEGFFSPMNIDETIKLCAAAVIAALYFSYLLLAGRRASDEPEPAFGKLMTPIPPV